MSARILIVDDNPLNLKLASLVVESAGHVADVADGPESALAAIAARRPDLILMDLQMPGIDGIQLTGIIKADPRTRGIPVVALTAAAMARDRERAAAAGCAGFITKPIDTRTFAAVLAPYLSDPVDRPS